ncbi:MAG: hypothetical protein ACYTGF_06025 [Planctomycetota bacterium]|jgi:hypothetical protein
MRKRFGMAVVAVGLLQGVATAQDVFTLKYTMTSQGVKTFINAPLQHGRSLNTGSNYWLIEVDPAPAGVENYLILFGPDPSQTGSTAGLGTIRNSTFATARQELVVQDGIAYFWGPHPYGGTEGGSGVGEGTIFVIQGRPDEDEEDKDDRFIYLDLHTDDAPLPKLTVYKMGDNTVKVELDTINTYVNIKDGGDMTGVTSKSLRPKTAIRNMLWDVVKLVEKAWEDDEFEIGRPLPY